jgi:F420-non-reducing hydrogenase small subunit
MSFLELGSELVGIFDQIELKRTPFNDIKEITPVTVGILEGAVSTDEDVELAKEFRKNSKVLVSLGTCPAFGGIGGLRNFTESKKVCSDVYVDGISTVDGKVPSTSSIPHLTPKIVPLSNIVKVDFSIPGCPPPKDMIKETILHILGGPSIRERKKNLCIECPRTKKTILQPQRGFLSDRVNAVMELSAIDSETCLLEQGVLCLGPVTVEGCGARCPKFNMPCRSCLGPTGIFHDQGAKMIDSLATLLPAGALMFMEDVPGTGYRFSLPYAETLSTDREVDNG